MSELAIVPELYVTDLAQSLSFYCGVLRFTVSYERAEQGFAAIAFRGSHMMLEAGHPADAATDEEFLQGSWRTGDLVYPRGRGVSFQMTVPDVDSWYARATTAGCPIKVGLHERSYRVDDRVETIRQFLVLDPDGYLVRVSELVQTAEHSTVSLGVEDDQTSR